MFIYTKGSQTSYLTRVLLWVINFFIKKNIRYTCCLNLFFSYIKSSKYKLKSLCDHLIK